ncbi:diguanylate cyclase [Marinobacterium sp. D7]|uniref:diguanylate cyclase n=1 Tax=Marinobacterium ramblicola TaxID=2849041 RepID=UPI001C2D3A80|nr:diguanylate cyclase [Marinobacterium ramblicola]MBV1789611.1 diguanylate cyclase [Marinobacterium ramblicola]
MNSVRHISAFWRRRSLKFWLATGMLLALAPISLLSVFGYLLYEKSITRPLIEVSREQREILQPLQKIQLSLWDMSRDVIDYSLTGENQHAHSYRRELDDITQGIASLSQAVGVYESTSRDMVRLQRDWDELNRVAGSIMTAPPLGVASLASQRIQGFEAGINQLGQDIGVIFEDVRRENERIHDIALADFELSELLIVMGFALSLLFAGIGVLLINRSLVKSTDQLLAGAKRIAAGDRESRIAIELPCELVNLAEAFNLMTDRIDSQEQALLLAARTDDLTGLYNRREFDRILTNEIGRGARYGKPLSLIMCDIDHFKRFNDSYGHQAGDQALRAVAATFRAGLREVDQACRYGGEELALILPECDAGGACMTAERVRQAVEALKIRLEDGREVRVSLSLGVATYPEHGGSYETLLQSADGALYQAKQQGRNRVVVWRDSGMGTLPDSAAQHSG